VIAVEPTDYAFAKLSANAGLNVALAQRLVAVQAALSDGQAEHTDKRYYSRWPLQDRTADSHTVHWGEPEAASGARFLSLDALLDELRNIGRARGPVSFMKIDVDGHEVDVLAGGRRTFTTDRPAALIEIAPYAQDEVPGRFETLFGLLKDYGYRLEDAGSGEPLPLSTDAFRDLVKVGAGADVLATPAS
jgi:FkbM family methyltransferase